MAAFYRTYRPRSLQEVVGQEHITQTLVRALAAGRVSHAYLFTGPRGVGKTSVARILAHEINKLEYGETPHLDIIEIDAASNRRIDDIRDLRDKVHIAPVSATYKVYIIDEVHMLTGESFNALLKTLEEPPAHVVFILATTEAHKLPATIISRTQRHSFRPVSRDRVVAHLREIATKENIAVTDEALALIAEHGEGSFRDSISLLDQLAHSTADEITVDDAVDALGLAPASELRSLVDALLAGDRALVVERLNRLEAGGTTATVLVPQLAKALADQALTKPALYELIDALLDVPRAYHPSLKLLTTLVRHTGQPANHSPNPPQPSPAAPPSHTRKPARATASPSASPPATKITPEPQAEPAPPLSEPPAIPAPDIRPASVLAAELTGAQWGSVLTAIKKQSPPLFGALKQAEPRFNTAENTLTIAFKYTLHSKKLEDPKQKVLLASTIQATLGSAPEIKTIIDKNAAPPVATDDPIVANVAAIMGGGEIIDAEAI